MKIDFEFDTQLGMFRDALHLPDDHALTDAEIETLEAGLEAIDPDDSMAVEELDGFFAYFLGHFVGA